MVPLFRYFVLHKYPHWNVFILTEKSWYQTLSLKNWDPQPTKVNQQWYSGNPLTYT